MQEDGDAVFVAESLVLRQALLPEPLGQRELAGEMGGAAVRPQRPRPEQRRNSIGAVEELAIPALALRGVPEHPQLLERHEELQAELDLPPLERPGERPAQVRDLRDDDVWVLVALAVCVQRCRECKRAVVRGVAPPQLLALAELREALEREFTNRLEHEEARADQRLDQARLADGADTVDCCLTDDVGGPERERAREDGESREEILQVGLQQVVAPLDRRAQRLLTRRRVACAARQRR